MLHHHFEVMLDPLLVDLISWPLAKFPKTHHRGVKECPQLLPVEVTVSVEVKEIEDKSDLFVRRR